MSDDRNGKTYSFDVCSNCKLMCCQGANPPLTQNRERLIEAYLFAQKSSIKGFVVHEEYSHPAADGESFCILFNKSSGKCCVHSVKPETCRAGPITFDINLKTGKIEWFLKKEDICAYAGKLYGNHEMFEEHFEVAKSEILRLVRDLDGAALRELLKIPEPETFKIGENDLPQEVLNKLGIA